MDPFIGQIMLFGGNFAPRGWATCDGQLLDISQNSALFSILGTTYGGDGRTTFGLPDLRGRTPLHHGQGPGLTSRRLGEKGGEEAVTLNASQMPQHTHTLFCQNSKATSKTPVGQVSAIDASDTTPTYGGEADAKMNDAALSEEGGNQPHDNMPPFGVVNYVIALVGIYPSRN